MNRAFAILAVATGLGLLGACVEDGAPAGPVAEHIQPSTLDSLAAGETLTLDLSGPDRVFVIGPELSSAHLARLEVLADGARTPLPDWLRTVGPDLGLDLAAGFLIASPGGACEGDIFGCADWWERRGCTQVCFALDETELQERAERRESGCPWFPQPRVCAWDCPHERNYGEIPPYEQPAPPDPPGSDGSMPGTEGSSSGGGSPPSPSPGTTTPAPGF